MARREALGVARGGLIVAAALLTAACDAIPADPEQTSARVRAEGRFRVGLVAGPADRARIETFLAGVAQAAGARPDTESGATEPLLKKLERGALDVVIGPMTAKSPWALDVHVLPLETGDPPPPDEVRMVAMARNGENRWISLLHREASAVAER